MAEMMLRTRSKRIDRWMPRPRLITRARVMNVLAWMGRALPGYLLMFADVMGIPVGFGMALVCANAAVGARILPIVTGCCIATVVRAFSGLSPHWEMMVVLPLLLLFAPALLKGCGNWLLMALAGSAMFPTVVFSVVGGTASQIILALSGAALSALSAPVFARAVAALRSGRAVSSLEERLACGYLAAILICGAARMAFFGVNLGAAAAAFAVASTAMVLGGGAAALLGMLAGVALSLMGQPLAGAIALSMGGFLAGVTHMAKRRLLTAAAFALGACLPLILCGWAATGLFSGMIAGGVILASLPESAVQALQRQLRRCLPQQAPAGDAYAAQALERWQQTVSAMARAVPCPAEAVEERTGTWWEEHLCAVCPDRERCGAMQTGLAMTKAEAVWSSRASAEEGWNAALEHLRGLGCQRLYHLIDGMNALRREDEHTRRLLRQAEAQRLMLVTHLNAMSGAARHFATISRCSDWWEESASRSIAHLLDETAAPARLKWIRRVDGHVQCGIDCSRITGMRELTESLSDLVSAAVNRPMEVAETDGEHILLAEKPPMQLAIHAAAASLTAADCGDTAHHGRLADGRFLITLSDGMGHGARAALISRQTVELMRLCLDAGYRLTDALTAVNGMLLMGGVGERFATADVLLIDLWSGQAVLTKHGAASTWHAHEGELTRIAGEALPLGIIEPIEGQEERIRLQEGDVLILLTDGVEEAFPDEGALSAAIHQAVEAGNPAEALLELALEAGEGQRRDDQSAVIVRVTKF